MIYKKLSRHATQGLYAPIKQGTRYIEVIGYGKNNRSGKTVAEALRDGDYIEWDNEKIKRAFASGNGTQKNFDDYVSMNRQYLLMLEV